MHKCLYDIPYAFKLHRKYRRFEKICDKHFQSAQVQTDNYYGQSFYDTPGNESDVQNIVQKHMKNNQRKNNQIAYLDKLATLANRYNHNIYIVIPPYRDDYRKHLPEHDVVFQELHDFIKRHKNITLLDFMADDNFNHCDFNDCHHLNKNGATKLTAAIKTKIN